MGRAYQEQFQNVKKTMVIGIGTVSTGAGYSFSLHNNKAVDINAIYLLSSATVAASDSNYYTCVFTNKGTDASGSTSVGTVANTVAGGAITAYVQKAVTLTATIADRRVKPGEVIQALFVKLSSPDNITDCRFIVEYTELS